MKARKVGVAKQSDRFGQW